MAEGLKDISYAKIDNAPKFIVNPEKLDKEVADLTGQMDLARSLSKQGMCTPESAARDTAELLKSLDKESGISINRAYSAQNSQASVSTSVDPKLNNTIQENNKLAQDQINNTMNGFGKTFSSLPQGVQNFFKKIFEFLGFKDFFTSKGKDGEIKDITKMLKIPNEQKILDAYGIKAFNGKDKGTTELQFGEKANIFGTKIKKENPESKDSVKIKIKEGKVILQDGANISSIKEGPENGTVTIIAINKDLSEETYILKDAKKTVGEQPKPA